MIETFEEHSGSMRGLAPAASLADASAGLPEGAYTTLRTYGGTGVVRLAQHASRLEASARAQGHAAASLPEDRLRRAIAGALQATAHVESRLRVTFAPPRLFVSIEPFAPLPPSLYESGVACVTLALRRPLPHAKETRFISEAGRAYSELPPGAHEGLMVAEDGSILEGLSSNFFAVYDGRLRTEEARSLPGVTRSMVLEVASALLPVVPIAVRLPELAGMSESFLTSVSRGVLPVTLIDGMEIGDGRPGPVTVELRRRFDQMIAREALQLGD